MNKKELRELYKKKRIELSVSEIVNIQNDIYSQIQCFNWTNIKVVHVFLPIKIQKEIDTYPIITFLRSKNIEIIISKSNFKTNQLTHYLFEEQTELKDNSYGIPEPINAVEVSVKIIDLVFVPLLISDTHNYRVGYGKGFYDRFLSQCKPDIKTIGLNFFPPVKRIKDIDKYDVALNHVFFQK